MKKFILKSKDVDFSSPEMKKRIKKILRKQKMIRDEANKPFISDLQKIVLK